MTRSGVRTLLMALLLVVGFIVGTTSVNWFDGETPFVPEPQFWTEAKTSELGPEERDNVRIYNEANAATVNITSIVIQRGFFFERYPVSGSGSGFLIDQEGRILTNFHVIRGDAPRIEVTLANKERYEAKIRAVDEANDLALIKIEAEENLPFLTLGESDELQVGQKVLAIGNPFGFDGTLTTGIISSLGRSIRDRTTVLEDMIQTDAAINPGNSGGPLLDSSGHVIGVNTAIIGEAGSIGIGFAMPISRAQPLLEYERTDGMARQAEPLGVRYIHIYGRLAQALELPEAGGFLLTEVERDTAAAAAGLRGAGRYVYLGNYEIPWGGDFVIAVDGREATNRNVLRQALALKHGGDTLTLTIIREGQEMDVEVTLRSRPARL